MHFFDKNGDFNWSVSQNVVLVNKDHKIILGLGPEANEIEVIFEIGKSNCDIISKQLIIALK